MSLGEAAAWQTGAPAPPHRVVLLIV